MPFLPPNQQHQSTEGIMGYLYLHIKHKKTGKHEEHDVGVCVVDLVARVRRVLRG